VKPGRSGAPRSASAAVTGLWQATVWAGEIVASSVQVASAGFSFQQTSIR
jgi:hypothetical protein